MPAAPPGRKKARMTAPLFSFAVVSDMHFMAYKDPEKPVDWVESLEEQLAYIASLKPEIIVSNGDLTNGKERDYRLAVQAIGRQCPMPVCHTMGNHEYYGYYEDEGFSSALAQERFLRMTGMPAIYYRLDLHGRTMLFLSTESYAPDMGDAGWLSEQQLRWLDRQLETACPDGPVFVYFHQPVNDTVADSNGSCIQSEQLRAILRKRPGTFLFSGHTHTRMDRDDQIAVQDGIVYVGGGCMCEELPQSRWVDVFRDRVRLRVLDHRERRPIADYDREFAT
jgi:Icc protein